MVLAALGIEPVPVEEVGIGIETAEDSVGHTCFPDLALNLDPTLDDLRPPEFHPLTGGGAIYDAPGVGFAAAGWGHTLAVDAGVDGDRVTRLSGAGRGRERFKRLGG